MSKDLVFYTNPMSRGRIVRWMLEEVGQPYRTEILDYENGMKGPAYLAVNPMGKVPAIKHGDTVVTEGAAICAYLADAFPEAGLAPALAKRGDYYRWLFFAAGPIEAAVTAKSLGFEPKPEQRRMAGFGSLGSCGRCAGGGGQPGVSSSRGTSSAPRTSIWARQIGWGMAAVRFNRETAGVRNLLERVVQSPGRGSRPGDRRRSDRRGGAAAAARLGLGFDQVPAVAVEVLEHRDGAIGFVGAAPPGSGLAGGLHARMVALEVVGLQEHHHSARALVADPGGLGGIDEASPAAVPRRRRAASPPPSGCPRPGRCRRSGRSPACPRRTRSPRRSRGPAGR